jgi:hypothetical protein
VLWFSRYSFCMDPQKTLSLCWCWSHVIMRPIVHSCSWAMAVSAE